ncbi:hypothetical protein HanXRQr2_Chr02g0054501 [Helianthus annuus]|uniref:Uncharacterized protein n=1 Tax=Helianthus annuus TaxID=4232 RepID=A0A251VGV8_HELAN|nr:hypothetical protein HanXRQr2_Chr02g0054501 [Helianthus annuus]KAJ0530576.1 hypothetical protein HanHA89_Chr10g0391411 [Helianthus annuus]KAJ0697430.1 hypothetical protein HanLR1_Chr10g0368841 [Helianthus annuus]KAJ0833504.1 hypothetical protein HanPSC8_Chr15g0691141 [Helianthus annuus]
MKLLKKLFSSLPTSCFKKTQHLMLKKVSFPVDLNKFIGKMFAFKIEITTYNMTNFDEMYLLQT